jgi:hypothetical protein
MYRQLAVCRVQGTKASCHDQVLPACRARLNHVQTPATRVSKTRMQHMSRAVQPTKWPIVSVSWCGDSPNPVRFLQYILPHKGQE